jgi:type II secretory ATPase GspE/PulE/Tfp pilus assembly ATPase PilB-like protein
VSPEKKVLTIEDPVEYLLPGTSQSQVRAQFGYTFPVAMRSFLRQDPDIIMVGEIRDLETCYISMQAALTGHMIFSTLHTNSAVGTITRMLDMGVEPFLISASISGIINQRLVRRLCPNCKQQITIDAGQMREMGIDNINLSDAAFYKSVGCSECGNRGFRGRIAIYEILCMTPRLGDVISKRLPEEDMLKAAMEGGMRTMLQDGLQMAAKGITTIDEVLRVLK